MAEVRLVCVDVDGTVSDRFRGPILPGTAPALAAIRGGWKLRLVTNATSRSHGQLAGLLQEQGLLESPGELVTPATAARRWLSERGHTSGLLFVEDSARKCFLNIVIKPT